MRYETQQWFRLLSPCTTVKQGWDEDREFDGTGWGDTKTLTARDGIENLF